MGWILHQAGGGRQRLSGCAGGIEWKQAPGDRGTPPMGDIEQNHRLGGLVGAVMALE